MLEIGKWDQKINVIPNGIEKYMVFVLWKSLILTESMQFMNSSLENLVKNLLIDKSKYHSQEFSKNKAELVKQNGLYLYEHMNSFERFDEIKLPKQRRFKQYVTLETY